jgi:hypothetical protein
VHGTSHFAPSLVAALALGGCSTRLLPTPIDFGAPLDFAVYEGTGAACFPSGTTPGCLPDQTCEGNIYPGGYCTHGCVVSENDPVTGLNASCPGRGTCRGLGADINGCFLACAEDADCRVGYVCVDGTACRHCRAPVRPTACRRPASSIATGRIAVSRPRRLLLLRADAVYTSRP